MTSGDLFAEYGLGRNEWDVSVTHWPAASPTVARVTAGTGTGYDYEPWETTQPMALEAFAGALVRAAKVLREAQK